MVQDTRSPAPLARGRTAFDWFFRSRETGRLAIVQLPNLPLALFLVLRVAQALLSPHGTAASVLEWAGTAALVWWASDEALRGVCPFRRLLGVGVLGWLLVGTVLN